MGGIKRLTTMGLAALGLCACETFSSVTGAGAGGENYAQGSAVEYRLSGADRDALAAAFAAAMDTGAAQQWRGGRATGAVEPGSYSVANLLPDAQRRIPASRGDLDLSPVMETELGLHVVTRNSNVRTGPGTQYKVAEMLAPGAGADVVGRVVNGSWMLVAVDGIIRGYMFRDLLIKAPGTELELAGGPHRKPVLCRNYMQRVVVYSERDEWTGAACNDGAGWRVAPPEPVVEEEDDLGLDGF